MANVSRVHKEISNCVRRYQGMNDPKEKFCVNILTDRGETLCSRLLLVHLPRVGDSIKRNNRHFAVIYVEWNMDELESAFTRVDIEVEEI